MKVYNAIGTLYNVFGRLKKKELIGYRLFLNARAGKKRSQSGSKQL